MNTESMFASLFEGRKDAFGLDVGGCARGAIDYESHLRHGIAIGVYPMVNDHVKWGCVDFDISAANHPTYDFEFEAEAHDAALDLVNVLRHLGITGWVERTRSFGRHVWVFASEWVPARTMRRALLVASAVAETPVREVNPKQETLGEGQLGNYVRLPYPGVPIGRRDSRYIYDGVYQRALSGFVHEAYVSRSTAGELEQAASLYVEPEPVLRHVSKGNHVTGVFPAYVTRMIEEGPFEGTDRSSFLFRLANKCYEANMSEEDAAEAVDQAASNCGKFDDRRDRDRQIDSIIRKVY
jgi:hypothetical protein